MSNASLLSQATLYYSLVSANSDMRAVIWNQQVIQTQRLKSKWRHFAGGEGAGMPITKKSDLSVGMAQDVVFTTIAPMLGQGVLGETVLRTATQNLNFNTFRVRVDILRQAFAYTQLLPLMRISNKTIDQVGADLTSDWWNNKYDDDITMVMREYCRLTAPGQNLIRIGGGANSNALVQANTCTPTVIEQSKSYLQSLGATPLAEDTMESSGATVAKFLFNTTDPFIRPMRTNATYLSSLQYADVRGKDNALYSGKYPLWDNNILFPDIMKTNDGDGRQGTPLMPIAFLGTAITDQTTTLVTGGGVPYAAGLGDYFAYFPGFAWYLTTNQSLPADSGTYYLMIYNISGPDTGKYEIVSYASGGVEATAKQITVTRTGTGDGAGNARALAAGRYSGNHPSGSVIVLCNNQGIPYGWSLHMGADAVFYATGEKDAEPIFQGDDFHDSKGNYMFEGRGIMGIRGLSVFVDKRNLAKNVVMVEGAIVPHPFVSPILI